LGIVHRSSAGLQQQIMVIHLWHSGHLSGGLSAVSSCSKPMVAGFSRIITDFRDKVLPSRWRHSERSEESS